MSGELRGVSKPPVGSGPPERTEEMRQHFAAIVDSSDDAIFSKSLDGKITSWNRGAELIYGYSAEEMVGKSNMLLIPPDRQDEEADMTARLCRGERVDHFETVRRRKDGALVEVSLTASPIRDASGKVVGVSKIARDITDRKRAVERQNLILGEMLHRVKNLAAVINALARQSQPAGEPAVEAFVTAFLGRVNALLSTGELVVASSTRQADLGQVLERAVRPFIDPAKASPITLDGPALLLPERSAGNLALATHELATNALKYGALKSATGRVSITWSIQPGPEGMRVSIDWRETGGSPVQPERQGFGSRVIRAAVSGERDGTCDVAFEPDGLWCRYEFTAAAR